MIKTSKTIKVIAILLMVITMVTFLNTIVNADSTTTATDVANAIGKNIQLKSNETLMGKVGDVVGWIRTIAVIAGVILLTVLGVKYMLGSVEEKAEYKKSLMPLVIGIVVVMFSTQIATWIFSVFQ